MIPRTYLPAAALALALLAPATDAQAFNCAIPGLFSAAKKTVCASPTLAALNRTETDRLAGLRARLGAEAMVAVNRDRRTFTATRDQCARDVRCHEATYTAQVRLYRRLDTCADRGKQVVFCVNRAH